jgi:hypothetical protein
MPWGQGPVILLNLRKVLSCRKKSSNIRKITRIIATLQSSLRAPLRSSGQRSWLQIQRSGFDFQRYQIFWEVVGLKRGPLSLVSKNEVLLGRKSSDSSLENPECGHKDPSRWSRDTLHPQKVSLTLPTSGGRLVSQYSSLADWSHVI